MPASTRKTQTETQAESMFGTPIYARQPKRNEHHKRIMAGGAAAALAIGATALLWASSAAQDKSAPVAAADTTAVAVLPAPTPLAPVLNPQPMITPEPVASTPARMTQARAVPARPARVASTAPSAMDNSADVSAREYAPVTPSPADVAAPSVTDQPPQLAPIPLIPE